MISIPSSRTSQGSGMQNSISPVLFTLDVEDHTQKYSPDGRYVSNTLQLLEGLGAAGVRGTCFFVGRVAEAAPELVREAVSHGHEIACHSWAHRPLDMDEPINFRNETLRAKLILEDLSGKQVTGFRAPIFSLIPRTLWALDVLHELGFTYSSSVLPASNPLYGFKQAPRFPFKWTCGLAELVCPVADIGPARLPYLGGVYFRYLPLPLIRQLQARNAGTCNWTYCHPYDFDYEEPFVRFAGANLATSLLLWFNRRSALEKLKRILGDKSQTFSEWLAIHGNALPVLGDFN